MLTYNSNAGTYFCRDILLLDLLIHLLPVSGTFVVQVHSRRPQFDTGCLLPSHYTLFTETLLSSGTQSLPWGIPDAVSTLAWPYVSSENPNFTDITVLCAEPSPQPQTTSFS